MYSLSCPLFLPSALGARACTLVGRTFEGAASDPVLEPLELDHPQTSRRSSAASDGLVVVGRMQLGRGKLQHG